MTIKLESQPEATPPAAGPARWDPRQTFAAFQYRNYRLWFMGQLASLVGTWMQMTAQGYLIFQLTHSSTYLGVVGFANGLPSWLLMLYGGVISDRMPRRNLLVITQTAQMILALVLAGLTFAGIIQPWHIVLLALLLGVANAFDAPARQAFVLEMVERKDMTNAIALNATMFNSAAAVGPAVAGLTYAAVGPAWCFTINAISFIAVIIALLLMNPLPRPIRARTTSAIQDLTEGVRYVASHQTIRTLIFILAASTLFGFAYVALIPAWAVKVLGGGPDTNGYLLSARGVGSMLGALMIASLGRFNYKGKVMTLALLISPVLLVVFALMRWLPLSLLAIAAVGGSLMMLFNLLNSLVQSHVSDELRGRVMGIYSFTFFGLMPLAALLAGVAADASSEPATVIASAAIGLALGVWITIRMPHLSTLE